MNIESLNEYNNLKTINEIFKTTLIKADISLKYKFESYLAICSNLYGNYTINLNDKQYDIDTSKLFYIFSNEKHELLWHDKSTRPFTIFVPQIEIDNFLDNLDKSKITLKEAKSILYYPKHRYFPINQELSYIMYYIKQHSHINDEVSTFQFNSYKRLLLSYFYRSQYKKKTYDIKRMPRDFSQDRLQIVIDYMYENYANDIDLDKLAAKIALNKYSFAHQFKNIMGISPHKYLIKVRLEKAEELICFSDIPINYIYDKVGFNNYTAFFKAFKNHFSISPQKYREIKQEEVK